MAEDKPDETLGAATENLPQVTLQRIYIKDCSFEAPSGPHFTAEEWKPTTDISLNTSTSELQPDLWEVVLAINVEAKIGDKTAFLVELEQAGSFVVRNVPEADMKKVMAVYCPTILFPYAREGVFSLVGRGGFPQFLIPPVNFEALVEQAEREQAQQTPNA